MTAIVAAACVILAAASVAWPAPAARSRRRRLLAVESPTRPPAWWPKLAWVRGSDRARSVPLRLLVMAGVGLAMVLGGPVAGAVAGIYGTLGARAAAARSRERTRLAHRAELLDSLGSAAADLRAGLAAETALAVLPSASPDPLLPRVRAAVHLAERTGAPLAEILERIETDARSTDRARAASAAQSAGSQATAWLLAALPAGGLALGYAIGTDPLAVLLHTPLGGACVLGAVGLQLAGLAWTRRITRPAMAVAS